MGKKSKPRPANPDAFMSPAELQRMTEARARAENATPGVVTDALLAQPIKVGQIEIPVIMLGHVLLLQKVNSPLAISGAGEPSNEEVAEALYILNHSASAVLELLAQGKLAWQAGVFHFASTSIPLTNLPAIGRALGIQLARAQSTVIGARDQNSPASSGEDAPAVPGQKKACPPRG